MVVVQGLPQSEILNRVTVSDPVGDYRIGVVRFVLGEIGKRDEILFFQRKKGEFSFVYNCFFHISKFG